MANIKEVKSSINKGVNEILDIGLAMERGSSTIKEDSIVTKFPNFPFDEANQGDYKIGLTKVAKDEILSKFPAGYKDGNSLLISLLSLKNNNKGVRNHIISLEIINNNIVGYFVNTSFLEEDLGLSVIFVDKLKNNSKYQSLKEVLNILIIMFLNKVDSYYRERFMKDDYEEYSVYKKIEMLKDMLNVIYSSKNEVDNMYYVFFTDDLNIKSTVYNYYKKQENCNYLNSFLYRIYNDKYDGKNLEVGKNLVKFEDVTLISNSQKNALKDINKQISVIIGQAGSGKTWLSSNVMKRFLYIVALGRLNKIKINNLYTTYSKYSMAQFLLYSDQFKDLILTTDKEILKKRVNELNKTIDLDRFKKIENSLKKYNLNKLFEKYKEKEEIEYNFRNLYKKSITIDVLRMLNGYLKFLKDNNNPNSTMDKMLIKMGVKKDLPVNIPNELVRPLIANNINVPNQVFVDEIEELIIAIQKEYLVEQKNIEKSFENIKFENLNDYTELILDMDIDFDDIVYYLKFEPIVNNSKLKEDYIVSLQNLINNDNINLDLISDLFPIFSGLTTEISEWNIQFRQIIVDEAVLVPGYFFPLIMSKGDNIITLGDINQLEMQQTFYPNVNVIIDKIYNSNGANSSKFLKLSVKDSYEQESFFGHIQNLFQHTIKPSILTDNFRTNKTIFDLSKDIMKGVNGYETYYEVYINKHELEENKESLTKHYSKTQSSFTYNNKEFKTPFVFIDKNNGNRYQEILNLIEENKINKSDLMIITPFKNEIPKIKTLIGSGVQVDTIENVQGVEKRVIVFDWNVESVQDEAFKYINLRRFNLILLRAKELFITIADEKFAFTNSIEDKDDGSGYSIVKKFLRNDKFNILKI